MQRKILGTHLLRNDAVSDAINTFLLSPLEHAPVPAEKEKKEKRKKQAVNKILTREKAKLEANV
jgi:hypothetical protein